ncbi:reticulon-like protein B21 isoform X2 [Humulus lupulus]|uniref:reticulon-like protein B21 isoform X2 n=1 Tax=Humulus lupulus TaxID=3486 RepID=UPI002B415C10|nr:reticulon-like protein B21 isoform X2 [Humulus lupulus]
MDVVGDTKRTVGTRSSTGVVAGSVWESRMKLDEVRGGIKVFIAGDEGSENQANNNNNNNNNGSSTNSPSSGNKLRKGVGNGGGGSKRKMWKPEIFEGFERSPIQNGKGKSDEHQQQVKEVSGVSSSIASGSGDGTIKRSPIQGRRLRSEGNGGNKELVKSPIGMRKTRSESLKEARESAEGIEKNSATAAAPLRKAKSVSVSVPARPSGGSDESLKGIGLVKVKAGTNEVLGESMDGSVEEIEKNPIESGKSGSDEGCKEFGVCEEKVISSNVEVLESAPKCHDDQEEEEEEEEGEEEHYGDEGVEGEEVDEEIEVEKSLDIKEINKAEPEQESKSKPEPEPESKSKPEPEPEPKPEPEPEPKPKPNRIIYGEKVVNEVKKVNFERRDVKKFQQAYQKQPEPMLLNVKKQQPPVIKRATVHSSFASAKSSPAAASYDYHNYPESHSNLQSFVDLIMWKEIPRSVFIFGIGTFTIISSAYTKDLNISFISVISYLGLVYLAATFLFRAIVCRGVIDTDYTRYVLGEEEAIWLLKLVLPYLNECLLKLKALFSGDPSTTMKLAVFLFVLARCGSSITIWTMAKLVLLFTFLILLNSHTHNSTTVPQKLLFLNK